jgi:CHAT domain-containing protein
LEFFDQLPRRLGAAYVEPWAHRLGEYAPSELLIVPHGALHRLPLHAAWSDGHGMSLGEALPLVYLGSAKIAGALAARALPEGGQRLVLGPADKSLPGAAEETRRLAARWQLDRVGQPYQYAAMTVDRLRHRHDLEHVHLATHSGFDHADFLRSRIQFYQSYLTVRDLIQDASLDLSGVRLFYLSSCESAQAQVDARSDDLQGLVWATLYAGANAVMATLWPVEDTIARVMAERFYEHLHRGGTLAEAYQAALRDLRRRDFVGGARARYACYWAPFVLYGNGWLRDAAG